MVARPLLILLLLAPLTASAETLRPSIFKVTVSSGHKETEATVLKAQFTNIRFGKEDPVHVIVPTLDIGIRIQRAVSVNPRAVNAVVPDHTGRETLVSLASQRFQGTWPITELPTTLQINLVDSSGLFVEKIQLIVSAQKGTIAQSEQCVSEKISIDETQTKICGAVFMGCDGVHSRATILHMGAQSLKWSPVSSYDRHLNSQLMQVNLSHEQTQIAAEMLDPTCILPEQYSILAAQAHLQRSKDKTIGMDAALLATYFNGEQSFKDIPTLTTGTNRSQTQVSPTLRADIYFNTADDRIELRASSELTALPVYTSEAMRSTIRFLFEPSIAFRPVVKQRGWTITTQLGLRNERYWMPWAHEPLSYSFQLHAVLGLRKHFASTAQTVAYEVGLAPSRLPGSLGFTERFIFTQELRWTHPMRYNTNWGLLVSHQILKRVQNQYNNHFSSLSAGLFFGF